MLNSLKISPLSGEAPRQAIIYLHGATRRASDISAITNLLMPVVPSALFLAPTAPLLFENEGRFSASQNDLDRPLSGHVWYPVDDFSPPVLYPRIKANAPALNAYLDEVIATYALQPSQIGLVGMSQGTMIGLYVALRRSEALAGVLGFSGALPDFESLPREIRSYPPVFLVHGTKDDQVPLFRLWEAQKALQGVGSPVETLAIPGLGHNIDPRGLAQGALFLRKIFGLAARGQQERTVDAFFHGGFAPWRQNLDAFYRAPPLA